MVCAMLWELVVRTAAVIGSIRRLRDELQAALAASAAERHVMPHIEGIPVLPPVVIPQG